MEELLRRGLEVPKAESIEQYDFEEMPGWFHEGQQEAWMSIEEVILILAGRQSGKTVIGPHWLAREIQRKGPGDYGFNGPSLELLKKKALPEFLRFFEKKHQLGRYHVSDREFRFSTAGLLKMYGTIDKQELAIRFGMVGGADGTVLDLDLFSVHITIYVGYARKPESLESATFKAVWSDEAGQPDFKLASYEALEGRRSVHNGRHLITTTPYDLGWLKTVLYDAWIKGQEIAWRGMKKWITVISFESTMNPRFTKEKFNEIRRKLAAWKFDLFYRGKFTRPAGAIYHIFEDTIHVVDPSVIPASWPRYVGMDFGSRNTAAVFLAMNPETLDKKAYPDGPHFVVYQTYQPKVEKDVDAHAKTIREKIASSGTVSEETADPVIVGGSWSEDEWREDYGREGLYIQPPPVKEVELGLDAVFSMLATGRLTFFSTLDKIIGDMKNYSREIDDQGEPIAGTIKDKRKWHRLDALRVISLVAKDASGAAQSINTLGTEAPEEVSRRTRDQRRLAIRLASRQSARR